MNILSLKEIPVIYIDKLSLSCDEYLMHRLHGSVGKFIVALLAISFP
jgi:hypothetical protein